VDEGVVEAGEDARDAEDELALPDGWAELAGGRQFRSANDEATGLTHFPRVRVRLA
jgi:hypothetical protein